MTIARMLRLYLSPGENEGGGTPPPNDKGGEGGGSNAGKSANDELMADLQKWKTRARELEKEKETNERRKLEETNQFKDLYEREKAKREEYEQKVSKMNDSFVNEKKYSALKDECQKLGLRAEAISDLEMLDLGQIQVETTSTGKVNILGAKSFAEKVKTLKPHWFGGHAPNVNTTVPRTIETSELTEDKVYDLYKEGLKSGDMSKYREATLKFTKQRSG